MLVQVHPSFLVTLKLRRVIGVTVPTLRRFSAVQMLPFLSLSYISPLLALLIIMFLSHFPSSLFLSLSHFPSSLFLSQVYYPYPIFPFWVVTSRIFHSYAAADFHVVFRFSFPTRARLFAHCLRKGTCSYVIKHPISHFVSIHLLSHSLSHYTSHLSAIHIPKIVHDAVANPGWRKAMEVEMAALHHNGTWDLGTPLVRRLLVVNGYTQSSLIQWLTWPIKTMIGCQRIHIDLGVEYAEIFSPVAKISFVHVIIATNLNWPLF